MTFCEYTPIDGIAVPTIWQRTAIKWMCSIADFLGSRGTQYQNIFNSKISSNNETH